MPPQNPDPVELVFPAGGLDQSLPANRQPALTTYALSNVRAFPPSSDRLGGGSREGSTKLFEDIAGAEDARRITGLETLTEAGAIIDPNLFSSEAVVEDWTTQPETDPSALGTTWQQLYFNSNLNLFEDAAAHSVSSDNLLMDTSGGTTAFRLIPSAHFIDNAVGMQIINRATRTCVTTNDGYSSTGPINVGPFIGAGNTLGTGIFACFRATGSDTMEAKVFEWNGITATEKATSGTLTLDGTSTLTDYTIKLTMDSEGLVTATFTATGALSGSGDIDEELTYTSTLTGRRGGILTYPRASGAAIANWRTITEARFTRLIPPETVYTTLNPALANPIDGNRYYLQSVWRGAERDAGGTLTVTAAGPTSASDPAWPAVDDNTDTIVSTTSGYGSSAFPNLLNYAVYQAVDQRYGIKLAVSGSAANNQDVPSPIFRMSADGRNGLFILSRPSFNSTTKAWSIRNFRGVAMVDNVVTDLGLIYNDTPAQALLVGMDQQAIRWTDDGTTIRAYINGVLIYTLDPTTFPNWTSGIGTSLAAYQGVGFCGGLTSANNSALANILGTVTIVQGEITATATFSNIKNKLAIFSPEAIQIGDTASLSIENVSGLVLQQPLPDAASFNRKFYAVDGSRDVIIDPTTLTSVEWAGQVTDGTLPDGCTLAAEFRGAIYLASTSSDPTIWFKSRTLDPLDWDYAADPQVSTAVAGNNGEVGQPADAITAMFAFSDDYLVFGMARSLGVLEGDPNYGGQFQIVSREAGIVGARAFCFDDRGNLFFLGAGGLYLMLKGTFAPEPVGPRKLRRELEELNLAENLIQMQFRVSDRTVRIYVTPSDGETAATCFVYDTRTEAYFSDAIPLEHGPWAIAQINGVADIDRNIIIGGNDGYIRRPDDDALTDDGTAIPSYVEIPIPDQGSGGLLEYIAQELQFVLAEGGGRITWRWFTGASPEEVRLQTVGSEVASGVITGTGFKEPIGLRCTGAAHKLRLEATGYAADGTTPNRWALERVTALLAPTSRRR